VNEDPVRAETLKRAAAILGGSQPLRAYLNVSAAVLAMWMSGAAPAPTEAFLKAVDVVVEKNIEELRRR
jgi:hypothetical protein